MKTDEEIDAFVRELGDSAYHPSCTCKMGDVNDEMSVVDKETKVKGIENLRIVDASIMPYVVSGNLNGPVIMMAEKAADIIKSVKLPKSKVKVYETPMVGQRYKSQKKKKKKIEKTFLVLVFPFFYCCCLFLS